MSDKTILIIDDEDKLRGLLSRILQLEGYKILEASTGKSALKVLENEKVQVILSDVKLPDANGVELTSQIKTSYPSTEIIVLTAYGTIQDGVKAIKYGAFDYITKGDDNDKIIPLVSKAMDKAILQQRVEYLERKVNARFGFDFIIGRSKAILNVVELAKKVAKTDTTVLLLGETGTGKEVFAQAIHYESHRRQKPFVAINCSAFSKEILESELFGHKAGAFTGAIKDKKGLFEEADGGTIFLDEIGEMNPDLQAKLLRVLESGTFIKVGDTQTKQVNVRIIAATNRDLKKETDEGNFRLDLFYRLSVFQIVLPPLRERMEDIVLLSRYYLEEFSAKVNRRIQSFDKAFLKKLESHPWKGNIRELKNVLERAVILCDTDTLTVDLLPFEMQFEEDDQMTSTFDLQTVEKNHIRKVLLYTKGNKTETAHLLNIGLTTLYRKMEEYKI
ncbi:sigma-54 dependent transcriptional regulator [Solitalea sp. MAHUQ-68]|uniref:Sigma-54 dependent transcriptional regulator n=1 Tax=Solitalea agri TaxID=2953739 RepID=A0A9X2F3Y3_9SPHI|nr:sigma-54 dependent transcriptional regulator [Solitalea agri]MCO4294282.1 sigma-54 dependent transcriptional regulator [Solitalea agri]